MIEVGTEIFFSDGGDKKTAYLCGLVYHREKHSGLGNVLGAVSARFVWEAKNSGQTMDIYCKLGDKKIYLEVYEDIVLKTENVGKKHLSMFSFLRINPGDWADFYCADLAFSNEWLVGEESLKQIALGWDQSYLVSEVDLTANVPCKSVNAQWHDTEAPNSKKRIPSFAKIEKENGSTADLVVGQPLINTDSELAGMVIAVSEETIYIAPVTNLIDEDLDLFPVSQEIMLWKEELTEIANQPPYEALLRDSDCFPALSGRVRALIENARDKVAARPPEEYESANE